MGQSHFSILRLQGGVILRSNGNSVSFQNMSEQGVHCASENKKTNFSLRKFSLVWSIIKYKEATKENSNLKNQIKTLKKSKDFYRDSYISVLSHIEKISSQPIQFGTRKIDVGMFMSINMSVDLIPNIFNKCYVSSCQPGHCYSPMCLNSKTQE